MKSSRRTPSPGQALALAAALLLAAACGYRLRGTGNFLPPGIRTISVPVFRNATTRYELDVKLTRAVINELVSRGRLTVTADPGKSDAVLEGEVLSFAATPVAFTGQARADRYNITVTAKIVLRDRSGQTVIFSNPSFIYNQDYEVPQGLDFESVETAALDKIAEKFARSLITTILEGF